MKLIDEARWYDMEIGDELTLTGGSYLERTVLRVPNGWIVETLKYHPDSNESTLTSAFVPN